MTDDADGPVHRRTYEVDAFDEGDGRVRLRGHLRDVRPRGLIPGDPDPLVIHDMTVDLVVDLATFAIVEAVPVMDVRPNLECDAILPRYDRLVGLSIARGFTHRVRELFGGPRGCSHVTALLQAMAPVAVQSAYTLSWGSDDGPGEARLADPAERRERARERFERNRNTCHVFADDGPMDARAARGDPYEPPIWAAERLRRLGRDPEDWIEFLR
ncbi:MAG: DUF2889 domain-containing protein [Acidimicrobiales bacterium]|nr:DUF2889 domain-containing protein [Acidimicrobiales bacterium]